MSQSPARTADVRGPRFAARVPGAVPADGSERYPTVRRVSPARTA
jgi:hypothetical protein